jgi:hypothetical protein
MANRWTIDDPEDQRTEQYEWRVPENDQEHVAETVPPGDLMIKPEDITLIPTKSPTQSGVQWGEDAWTVNSQPTAAWYIYGEILD